MEYYRLKINPSTWLNFITRESEKKYLANYLPSTLIWLIVLLGVGHLYSMIIAELALVATVLGDSAAALIGKGLGKHRLPFTIRKTIEGYIGGLLFTYVIGLVFLFIIGVQGSDLFIVPLLPTAAIAIFDFFEDLPFWAADNLFHPLITLIFSYIFTLLHLITI